MLPFPLFSNWKTKPELPLTIRSLPKLWQAANRDAAKAFPSSASLLLPVVPHVGETDTDTLTERPGRSTELEEEEGEGEDEFGYSWSEFNLLFGCGCAAVFLPLEGARAARF